MFSGTTVFLPRKAIITNADQGVAVFVSKTVNSQTNSTFSRDAQAIPSPSGVLFIQDATQVLVMDPATAQTLATIPLESSTWSCSNEI
jgi:hypothetical protein